MRECVSEQARMKGNKQHFIKRYFLHEIRHAIQKGNWVACILWAAVFP